MARLGARALSTRPKALGAGAASSLGGNAGWPVELLRMPDGLLVYGSGPRAEDRERAVDLLAPVLLVFVFRA